MGDDNNKPYLFADSNMFPDIGISAKIRALIKYTLKNITNKFWKAKCKIICYFSWKMGWEQKCINRFIFAYKCIKKP